MTEKLLTGTLSLNTTNYIRFINNDFTSSLQAVLASTNTVPLHVRRMQQMASEVFKIVNNISPTYIKDLINIKILIIISGEKIRQVSLKWRVQGMGQGHFDMRPPESGTVSRTIWGRLSPSHSSGGCSMLGMVPSANILLVQFRLCFVFCCAVTV